MLCPGLLRSLPDPLEMCICSGHPWANFHFRSRFRWFFFQEGPWESGAFLPGREQWEWRIPRGRGIWKLPQGGVGLGTLAASAEAAGRAGPLPLATHMET